MSARGETALVQHLLDADSLRVIAEDGLDMDIIPTEIVRSMVAWSLDYWFASGRTSAPSIEAFRAIEVDKMSYGHWVDDLEIDITVEPEDTIEWALADLRSTWVTKQTQDFTKAFAVAMATAHTDSRVEVVDKFAGQLVGMSMKLTPRGSSMPLKDGVVERLYEYELRSRNEGAQGAFFGLPEIDTYTNGIQAGELAVIAAGPKTGKAQPLDALLLTPSGWKRMGDVVAGDVVCGKSGPTTVLAIHPQGEVPVFRVVMSDGSSVEACGDHLWEVKPHGNGLRRVLTTLQVREVLLSGKRRKLYIPMAEPVEFLASDLLPLDPYLVGVLIGDGGMSTPTPVLTTADRQILDEVIRVLPEGVTPKARGRYGWGLVVRRGAKNPLSNALRDLGLMPGRSHTRFIPQAYLWASVADRMSLLQGLLDTDGTVEGRRSVSFCTTSRQLALDVRELVEGLGGVCRVSEKPTSHRLAYNLRIRLPLSLGCPFRLERKAVRWSPPAAKARGPRREIVAVEYVGVKKAQCITVDASDHLYLTEHAIVTHNSYMTAWIALSEMKRRRSVAVFTLENSVGMTIDRMACMAAGVDSDRWQRGECVPEEVEAVIAWARELQENDARVWVVQPDLGKRSIEHMIREAQIREAQTVIIDQLTFVELPSPRKPRHERIGEGLHTLKGLISTGRHRMPCFLAHQVNREGVKAADKAGRLEMHHMAESAEVERTADWVFGMYASPDERIAQQLKLQTLAARRAAPRHWQVNWQIGTGHISIRQQISLN